MRRVALVLATMVLALLLASGVALAVNKIGTDGPDTLTGTNGNDNLLAKGGNDILFSLNGRDNLLGGPGKDIVLGDNERAMLGTPAFGKGVGGVSVVLGVLGVAAGVVLLIDPGSPIAVVGILALIVFHIALGWKVYSLSKGLYVGSLEDKGEG